ncbi:MAG TPA: RNA polymerase sigma factor, partial [Candidatus Sulfotelmatobacter sp.]|nr:RNA polymerase sigma factor [Candidatus Sulfotelmatobacter sp.]
NPPAADSLDEPNDPEEDDCRTVQMGEEDLRLRGALDRVVLDRALGRLAPGCRQMFVLHDVEGYRHDEIAEIVGCSVGNSKSQLHKARMRLREILRRGSRDRRRGRARTLAVRSWWCERPKQLDSRMATPPV